eukprot:scaffold5953_cov95-Skeletonema_dohrnii-CCMP3373.AAC.4
MPFAKDISESVNRYDPTDTILGSINKMGTSILALSEPDRLQPSLNQDEEPNVVYELCRCVKHQ